MRTIVLASNNKDKIKDIVIMLSEIDVSIKNLNDFNLKDPIESGTTFEENARIKAEYTFQKTGLPTLSDDSGFCIKSINNFPGLYSGRFAEAIGSYEKTFEIINKCLPEFNREAFFMTCLCFIYNDKNTNQKIIKIFVGKLEGNFIYPPRGKNGFGYCPCFQPDGFDITMAEIDNKLRRNISHRAIAIKKFVKFYKKLYL